MKVLDRKLIREMMQMKAQVAAIALVIASGVAMFVMSLSTLHSLTQTQSDYYKKYRFADVFAHLKRAPESLVARIAQIPGVAAVQTRVVVDVTLDVEGLAEPAVGRLISIPEQTRPNLNRLHLRAGRYVEPGRNGEVLASVSFVESHGLGVGDGVVAVINGHKQRLEIVGVALSPEYIYATQPGQLIPDDKRFSVFWMGRSELEAAFDMQIAFNDVCLELTQGASEAEVMRRLDGVLDRYGGLGAYGRKDQSSHSFIEGELKELRGMSLIPPTIFLFVAAFLLNVVLSRLISLQRVQIAVF
jgi:putative ABC transport system permease protein